MHCAGEMVARAARGNCARSTCMRFRPCGLRLNAWGCGGSRRASSRTRVTVARPSSKKAAAPWWSHPNDKRHSLHPIEQRSLAGDPVSSGARGGRVDLRSSASGYINPGSAATCRCYLGGAGGKTSCRRPGSGFGLGFGGFLVSFLPLSLFPMGESLPQKRYQGKGRGFPRSADRAGGGASGKPHRADRMAGMGMEPARTSKRFLVQRIQ